jgi:hypothetical protein
MAIRVIDVNKLIVSNRVRNFFLPPMILTGKQISKQLPWRSWEEWRETFVKVVDLTPDSASSVVEIFRLWNSRCRLPLAVEATWLIIDIMREDPESSIFRGSIPASEQSLALAYSQAICRFVNLLIDVAQKGAVAASMDSLAVTVEMPAWIVQLRHNIAHGPSFPSLNFLRRGAVEMLDAYIIPKYWMPQNSSIIPDGGNHNPATSFTGEDSEACTNVIWEENVGNQIFDEKARWKVHEICNRLWNSEYRSDKDAVDTVLSDIETIDGEVDTTGLLLREIFRQRNFGFLLQMHETGHLTGCMKGELVRLCSDHGDDVQVFELFQRLSGTIELVSNKSNSLTDNSSGETFDNSSLVF